MYCNCRKACAIAGKSFREDASVFYATKVDREGICSYCGVYAVRHASLASAPESLSPIIKNRKTSISEFHRRDNGRTFANKNTLRTKVKVTNVLTGEVTMYNGLSPVIKYLKAAQKQVYKHANTGIPYKDHLIERIYNDSKGNVPGRGCL